MSESRRQKHREETIEEILSIARSEMRSNGVSALSLGEIARQMNIKTPSLYNYFDGKQAIYDELFRRGYEEYTELLFDERQSDKPVPQRLTDIIAMYMGFAQENPDLYQIMFQRPVPGFVPSQESQEAALKMLAMGREELAAILDSGSLHFDIPVEEAVDLFIALMHGLTEMHLANNPELPVGQGRYGRLIPQAVSLLLDSWRYDSDESNHSHSHAVGRDL